MGIPDCYDPVHQAERREAEADRKEVMLPHCCLCGETLYPGRKFHMAQYQVVCHDCLNELIENEDIVELEESL